MIGFNLIKDKSKRRRKVMGLFGLFEEHVENSIDKLEKTMKRKLRSKSDQEIEYLYNNRYNGNRKEIAIRLIEEEARQRGIC